VTKIPGAQQIKKEKRELHIEPAPVGMSRRRFLTFLGTGSAALAAGSSGVLAGCAKGEEEGVANKGSPRRRRRLPSAVTETNGSLGCEENFQYYYGESSEEVPKGDALAETYRWLDDPDGTQTPEHYGWVVEVDPFDKNSTPRKHTWLVRIRHECVAMRISDSNRIVAYTGHDEEDERIYKFVSSGKYDADNREANFDLLSDGMLYVADFATGRWIALDYEKNPLFKDNGFKSQADVLVRAPEAAAIEDPKTELPIGTPMDRCEDIEVHLESGQVYCALTNNELHANFYGQILRITEAEDNPEATEFTYEVFAAGGP
jgi:secreted PhoX family phosphatase